MPSGAESPDDITDDLYEAQLQLLNEAYENGSQEMLETFLQRWQSHLLPIPCSQWEQLGEVEREVYKIYADYYNPFDTRQYGSINSRELNVDYVIVQDRVWYNEYNEQDDDNPDWRPDLDDRILLTKFRPALDFDSVGVLHLSPRYSELLHVFVFGGRHPDYEYPPGTQEDFARLAFLSQKVDIVSGHDYYPLLVATHPEVFTISVQPSFELAKLSFRIGYEGGSSWMEKNAQGTWEIVRSEFEWIQ